MGALAAQAALFGLLVFFVVHGFPFLSHAPGLDRTASASAAGVPAARADRFDAPAAMALMRRQVAVGQRPAGSPQLRRLADEVLRPALPRGRFEDLPPDPEGPLRNIVGTLPGRTPAIVVGAHYDSESHPKGFVGANDSAAGTAALIEVARAMAHARRPRGARELRFVLFDGEEERVAADNRDFYANALRGSKAYVAAHPGQTRTMVLLDYIANTGVRLPREPTSDTLLWDRVRAAARAVGVGAAFPPGQQATAILDDHTPFLRAGIPAVDFIDFSYRYADGLQDTPDKLSVRSMDAVGETVVELLRRLDASGY